MAKLFSILMKYGAKGRRNADEVSSDSEGEDPFTDV